jgi:hypothetical protein
MREREKEGRGRERFNLLLILVPTDVAEAGKMRIFSCNPLELSWVFWEWVLMVSGSGTLEPG